jgi:hypothetical protein
VISTIQNATGLWRYTPSVNAQLANQLRAFGISRPSGKCLQGPFEGGDDFEAHDVVANADGAIGMASHRFIVCQSFVKSEVRREGNPYRERGGSKAGRIGVGVPSAVFGPRPVA